MKVSSAGTRLGRLKLFRAPMDFIADANDEDSVLEEDEKQQLKEKLRVLMTDAADDVKLEAVRFLTMAVQTKCDAYTCFQESDLAISCLIEFGFKKNSEIRQSVMELIASLVSCGPEMADVLTEKPEVLLLICKTLLKIESGYPCRCTSLKCLHHIARQGLAYRRPIFDFMKVKWSKKRPNDRVSPLMCVMRAIETEIEKEVEVRCATESEGLSLCTDEAAEQFRVSSTRFIAALMERGNPQNGLLPEIIAHVVSVAVDSRNPSCVVYAVHGTALAAYHYYEFFYSPFKEKAGIAHYKWLLAQDNKEICTWVLETFIIMASKSKEEARDLYNQKVLADINPDRLDDDGIGNFCKLIAAFAMQLENVSFSSMLPFLDAVVTSGVFHQKIEAMSAYYHVLTASPQTEVHDIVQDHWNVFPVLVSLGAGLDDENDLVTYLKLVDALFSALASSDRNDAISELATEAELQPLLETLCLHKSIHVSVTAKQIRSRLDPDL